MTRGTTYLLMAAFFTVPLLPGCIAPSIPDQQQAVTNAYQHDANIRPARIASCLDDNPNPGAGCL